MASVRSEHHGSAGPPGPTALKAVVSGGFGVGKTTFVAAVSEVRPLRTEEALTEAGRPHDSVRGVSGKEITTVAMDFGRITLGAAVVLYLFGTPGQERFRLLREEMAGGALCAVVLVDTRRLAESFPALDCFEARGVPFVVAVNCFDGAERHPVGAVRTALDLAPEVPVVHCDARRRDSVRETLVTAVEHAGRSTAGRRSAPR